MADMQVTVGGTGLDNATTRKIFGQPINDYSVTGGVQVIQVSFHLESDNTDALQTLWAATKAAFNTKDATVVLTYDTTASPDMESFSKGQDDVIGIMTGVRQSSGEPSSKYSMECILDIVVELIPETPTSGQVGDIVVSTSYSAGRRVGKSLSATYKQANGADALTNYNSARATLLTDYLGVDSDGGRNSSSRLALIGENVAASYGTTDSATNEKMVTAALVAEEITQDFSSLPSLRQSDIQIGVSSPEVWLTQDPVSGGARPTTIAVAGSLTVSKDAISNMSSIWTSIESQVKSLVNSQTGKSCELISKDITLDPMSYVLSYNMALLADNVEVFEYSRVDVEQEDPAFVIFVDSDGYETVQKRPGVNPLIRSISVQRTGVGQANITPAFGGIDFNLSRSETGNYIQVGRNEGSQGPFENDFSGNIYVQNGSYTYRRVNFKFGDDVQVIEVGA